MKSGQAEENAQIENLFAGENSKGADLKALDMARQLDERGVSGEEIRQQTGWFKGMDGKWRYEMADNGMKTDTTGAYSRNPDIKRRSELEKEVYFGDEMNDKNLEELRILENNLKGVDRTPKYLDEIVSHPELFEAYPELKNVRVLIDDAKENVNGSYSPGSNVINISRSRLLNKDELKQTLIHEIQHAIQKTEGFSSGASADYYNREDAYNAARQHYEDKRNSLYYKLNKKDRALYDEYRQIEKELNGYILNDGANNIEDAEALEARSDELYKELYQKEWFGEILHYDNILQDTQSLINRAYIDTAGEIEARDAAKRRNMDTEARRLAAPDLRDDAVFSEKEKGLNLSFEGYDKETGKGIYRSNFPEGTPKSAKAKRILDYIQNVWSKKPISLWVEEENGEKRKIQAQFDPTYDETGNTISDASKLMGGNKRGNGHEKRVTLDLADDYYKIASESKFFSKKNAFFQKKRGKTANFPKP